MLPYCNAGMQSQHLHEWGRNLETIATVNLINLNENSEASLFHLVPGSAHAHTSQSCHVPCCPFFTSLRNYSRLSPLIGCWCCYVLVLTAWSKLTAVAIEDISIWIEKRATRCCIPLPLCTSGRSTGPSPQRHLKAVCCCKIRS